LEDNVACIRLQ